ncbi:MAG: hypothetical protein KKC37_17105 [Proteobacteria bacterium]|nr:hypothetical protein [Pseudomonadota bacterium]
MTIGTNRIYQLTPTDCSGKWGHPLTQVFGCTVYDTAGGAFTLRSVTAERTTGAGVVTTETVHDGVGFVAPWIGAGSAWNPATGVLTCYRVGGYVDGMQIKFVVCSRDGAGDDTYSTFYVGIGFAPGTLDPPVLNQRVMVNGKHFRITQVVGAAGSVRYECTPTDHSMAGVMLLYRNEFEYVSARGRLDARILVGE